MNYVCSLNPAPPNFAEIELLGCFLLTLPQCSDIVRDGR